MPLYPQSKVTVEKNGDQFQLMVNDKPFFINGAGGTDHLAELRDLGGNSIRTWGIESLEKVEDGKPLLARAKEMGLMVTVGIWIAQPRKGFDYGDSEALDKQRDMVREAVKKYKDDPAVLIWGLGNEVEGSTDGSDVRIWKELNVLAGIIKEEDPNHPVMIVLAGPGGVKIRNILENCPNVDILGVNAYGNASSVGASVTQQGWDRPFILTEFGPSGQWEVPKTAWGAPIEATANDKAASYYVTENMVTQDSKNLCLGTYAFLWGHKQEATSTWYGMFLKTGERLPQADAMSRAWTGHWPAVRCPKLKSLTTTVTEQTVPPGTTEQASAVAVDPNVPASPPPDSTTGTATNSAPTGTADNASGSSTNTAPSIPPTSAPLQYEWSVVEENTVIGTGGDEEPVPTSHPECITGTPGKDLTFTTPSTPGAYRLCLIIRNGKGGATTANVPFQVK